MRGLVMVLLFYSFAFSCTKNEEGADGIQREEELPVNDIHDDVPADVP